MSWIKDGLVALGGWQILFTMLNTLILYLGLKHFLFEPVKKMMDERTASIEGQIASAEEKEQLADRKLLEYEQQIKNVREEGIEIIREAKHNAQVQCDEMIEAAKEEAEKIVKKGEGDIARDKAKAMNEMKNDITDIAMLIAEKIIKKNMNEEDQDHIIEECIRSVGDTKWEN